MAISKLDYNLILIREGKSTIPTHKIKTYIPILEIGDVRRGYIIRYFIQRFNDDNAIIYEVNATDFQKYTNDLFYNCIKLEWRITGLLDEISFTNENSIKLASKKMPGIIFYLVNYLQFAIF